MGCVTADRTGVCTAAGVTVVAVTAGSTGVVVAVVTLTAGAAAGVEGTGLMAGAVAKDTAAAHARVTIVLLKCFCSGLSQALSAMFCPPCTHMLSICPTMTMIAGSVSAGEMQGKYEGPKHTADDLFLMIEPRRHRRAD